MADTNDQISNTSKPAKAPTEKKKRKRPSKKVPTTVLQANNSGFMHLVQKLTGSAEELAAATVDSTGTHSQTQSSPYSNQLEPMTSTYQSTATPEVGTYSSMTTPYSSFGMGSYDIQEPAPYQPYQQHDPENYGGGPNYAYGGGYGSLHGYGSGGYGGSGYGEEDENSTYEHRGPSGNPNDRYDNNNTGSSPSSSWGADMHRGSPMIDRLEFGIHSSSSDYYW